MVIRLLIFHLMLGLCHARTDEKIPNFAVTDKEIVEMVDEMFDADTSGALPGQIILDFQGHTTTRDATDNARSRLFKYVDPNLLQKVTYRKFIALNDVYQPQTGVRELETPRIKRGEVSGMHSWLRFYLLERNASQGFDYRGYTVKRYNFMASVKFSWRNELKRSGSFFIGTSPEFDLALDTLCFLSRRSRKTCNFKIEHCPFSITSYELIQQGKVFIGTIYPTAGPITDECRNYH